MPKRTLSGRKPRTKRSRTRRHRGRSSCRRGGGRGARRGGAHNATRDIHFPYNPLLQTPMSRPVVSDLDLPLHLDPADHQLVKSLDIDGSRASGNQTRKPEMQGGKRRTRRPPKRIGRGAPCQRCWTKCKCSPKRGCGCGPACGCKRCRVGCGRVWKPLRRGCRTCRKTLSVGVRGRCAPLKGGSAPGPLRSLWWDVRDSVETVGSAALGTPLAGRVRGVPKFLGRQIKLLPPWLPGA